MPVTHPLPVEGDPHWTPEFTLWADDVEADLNVRLSDSALQVKIEEGVESGVAAIPIVSVDDFDADADFGAALSAAIDHAATIGGQVVAKHGKTYYARTSVSKTNVPVFLNLSGSRVLRAVEAPSDPILTIVHTNTAPVAVVALTTMTYDYGGGETTPMATRIEVASTAGWAIGDYAVIVADDSIVGADPARAQREGERVRIGAVDATYLWVLRPLRVTLTTNIRVARMTNLPIIIEEPHFEDAPGSPEARLAPAMLIQGAVHPRLVRARMENLLATGVVFQGCVDGEIRGGEARNLRTSDAYGSLGYGFRLDSCCDFRVFDLNGAYLRHVFTSGASESTAAGSTSLWRFGSNIGHTIVDAKVTEGGHSGVDLHEEATYCVFESPRVAWGHSEPSGTQFSLTMRGRRNEFRSPSSVGPYGVRATAYPGGGNFVITDHDHLIPPQYTAGGAFDFNFTGFGGRALITYSGTFRAYSLLGILNSVQFADLRIPRMEVTLKGMAGSTSLFDLRDSRVEVETLVVNMQGSDPAAIVDIFRFNDGLSSVRIQTLIVRAEGTQWRFGDMRGFTGGTFTINRVLTDTLPLVLSRGFQSGGLGAAVWAQDVILDGTPVSAKFHSRGNGNTTLGNFDGMYQQLNAALTADRTVTEASTNRPRGDRMRFIRSAAATGAFSWIIGTDALTAPSTWLERAWLDGAWVTVGKGTI